MLFVKHKRARTQPGIARLGVRVKQYADFSKRSRIRVRLYYHHRAQSTARDVV